VEKISFVIPVFNEEKSIEKLYQEIKASVAVLGKFSFEIIFIDDGSTDESQNVMRALRERDRRIEIVKFRKNLGKSVALGQGFRKATGDLVVTLDADLQDDPINLKILIKKMEEGYDCVVGWKEDRKDPLDKTLPSKIFNLFVSTFSKLDMHDFNCGLKLFKKEAVKNLRLYGELHRFIPVLVNNAGFLVTEVSVTHREREFGVSKYGWPRFIKGFFDFITVMFLSNFGQKPLHLFGLLGMFAIILGAIFAIYLSILHFQGYSIGTRPLLNFSILLIIAGLQMISTGLIAEMIVSRSRGEEKLPIEYETLKRR
jgi:glycosyltransferase involved in cell wall biosynthesis